MAIEFFSFLARPDARGITITIRAFLLAAAPPFSFINLPKKKKERKEFFGSIQRESNWPTKELSSTTSYFKRRRWILAGFWGHSGYHQSTSIYIPTDALVLLEGDHIFSSKYREKGSTCVLSQGRCCTPFSRLYTVGIYIYIYMYNKTSLGVFSWNRQAVV